MEKLIVNIKKLHPNAVIPTYAHVGTDVGMDITAVSIELNNHDYIGYKTGLAIEIPKGYGGFLFPRSSISKKDLSLCNSVGIIDPDYLGEVEFRFNLTSFNHPKIYGVGDKIGQLVIMPYPQVEFNEVDSFEPTVRGTNGFGSTDNK